MTLPPAAAQESGHTRDILSLAFSPDGKWLATASDDDTVKLWTWPDPKPMATLNGHRTATAVRFSPDGTLLATAGTDETVRLWDVATRKQIRSIQAYSRDALAFSPNGELLAIGDGRNNAVLVVGARDLSKRYEFLPSGDATSGGYVSALSFSPDGRTIVAAGYRESVVHVFDAADGKQEILKSAPVGGRFTVRGAAFFPNGVSLAVAGGESNDGNGVGVVIQASTGTIIGKLTVGERGAWITSVAVSPDGQLIATGVADKAVRLWDANTLSLVGTLTGAQDEIRAVTFAPDGKSVAAASGAAVASWVLTRPQP